MTTTKAEAVQPEPPSQRRHPGLGRSGRRLVILILLFESSQEEATLDEGDGCHPRHHPF